MLILGCKGLEFIGYRTNTIQQILLNYMPNKIVLCLSVDLDLSFKYLLVLKFVSVIMSCSWGGRVGNLESALKEGRDVKGFKASSQKLWPSY